MYTTLGAATVMEELMREQDDNTSTGVTKIDSQRAIPVSPQTVTAVVESKEDTIIMYIQDDVDKNFESVEVNDELMWGNTKYTITEVTTKEIESVIATNGEYTHEIGNTVAVSVNGDVNVKHAPVEQGKELLLLYARHEVNEDLIAGPEMLQEPLIEDDSIKCSYSRMQLLDIWMTKKGACAAERYYHVLHVLKESIPNIELVNIESLENSLCYICKKLHAFWKQCHSKKAKIINTYYNWLNVVETWNLPKVKVSSVVSARERRRRSLSSEGTSEQSSFDRLFEAKLSDRRKWSKCRRMSELSMAGTLKQPSFERLFEAKLSDRRKWSKSRKLSESSVAGTLKQSSFDRLFEAKLSDRRKWSKCRRSSESSMAGTLRQSSFDRLFEAKLSDRRKWSKCRRSSESLIAGTLKQPSFDRLFEAKLSDRRKWSKCRRSSESLIAGTLKQSSFDRLFEAKLSDRRKRSKCRRFSEISMGDDSAVNTLSPSRNTSESNTSLSQANPDDVLSLIEEAKLTKQQYLLIRKFVNSKISSDALPSYQKVLKAKKLCYRSKQKRTQLSAEI